MRKLIPMVLVLVAVGFLLNIAALAATTGNVNATVTAQDVSVAVTDGTVTYGNLALGATSSTIALSDTQTASNTGNVLEDFSIKGTSSASWLLSGTAGSEQYVHEFSTSTFPGTALTTNYQTLATNVATGTAQTFDLQITTPTGSADFSQQDVSVIVMASAAQ